MAIRTYKINLDSKNTIAPEPIFLRQGDKTGAVIIDASITDNGSAFNLAGLTPVFKANTADNKAVIIDSKGFSIVDASNGKFTYKVPGALSTAPGKIRTAYFGFTDSSGVESTFNLTFVVQAAPDVGTVKSENYITVINGAYANIAELTAAYPQGNPGIFLTTNDLNWYYWDDKKGAWISGGPFNAYPSTNLIKNGDFVHGDISSLNHNDGVSLAPQNFDSMDWANVTGNINQGNTDAYFNIPVSGDTSWVQWTQLKFDCDINSPKISNLKVFIDLNFTAGSSRTVLINQLTLQINQHNSISVLTPNIYSLKPDNKTISSINIGIASIDDDVDYCIGKAKITRYNQPVNKSDYLNNYKINQKDNLVEDSQLLTGKTNMRVTHGTVSLANINGHNWNQMTAVDPAKKPEVYYGIDKRTLPYPLSNFINRKWLFEGKILCDTDSDYMIYCDAFDQAGVYHRINIGGVHVYANKKKAFSFETPTISEILEFTGTDVTVVNFVVTGQDPNVVSNVTDIFIKPFAPKQKKTTLDYFEKDAIAKYGTSLVGHDGSVRTVIRQFAKLDWIYAIPTPPSNNEIYLRVPKPNNNHDFDGYYYTSIRLGLAIVSEAAENFTLRLDIVDKTGKITSKDLGVYYVRGNQRKDIKVDTPLIKEVYRSDYSNIDEIRFVISPENKSAHFNTGNYSMTSSDNFTPQSDSMILPEFIPYSLGNWFRNNGGITNTDILENNVRKLSIKGVPGTANTDLYYAPTMLPEFQGKRWQEHLVFEPDIDCNVTTEFDELDEKYAIVEKILLGSHKVLAGQKVLLNDVSPKLSDYIVSPNHIFNFNIRTDMPNDKLSYKISEFYIKEYIPETLSSPYQSTSGASKLPELRLYGDVPASATDKTTNSFIYQDGSYVVNGYTKTSWNGQSSKSLPKKSYEFKPYSDAEGKTKLSMQIDPKFAPANHFVLKAVYSDPTLSLDNIGNEIMHDLAASRKTFSKDLNSTAYLGQTYGKPIELYFNDNYQGLYFFQSGADEERYGFDGKDANKFMIEGESESGAVMFQAPHVTKWGDGIGADLEVEFDPIIPDTLTENQKAKFNAFVKMVNDGNIETFKANTLQTSVEAAIDYIIFYNLMGSVDTCGRNLEWATWDNGAHFTVISHDLDQLFFNGYNGHGRADKNVNAFPVVQMRFGTTHNKYFDLIAKAYPKELNDRYYELRKTIMREDNVIKRFTDYGSHIGIANYNKEQAKWPIAGRRVNYQYLQNIVYDRFKLVDTQFAAFIAPLLVRK